STGDEIADEKVPAIIKPRINVANAMAIFNESPPVAMDVNEITESGVPVTITLNATDEGIPNPPAALSYSITSLPNHGTLAEANDPNNIIMSVPFVLSGSSVIYIPRFGCDLPVSFTYIANDSGIAPNGGDSNEAMVSIKTILLETFYSANMDTDPNWTYEGDWAWGTPAGDGGVRGNPDPTSGCTGSNVIGYNLAGDYIKNMSSTEWTTTPAIDCNGLTDITFSFYRWLNVDSFGKDDAVIEVSVDGIVWTRIWQNDVKVTDSSWTPQTFDISAIADNQSTVYIRWGMGPTNNNQNYSGWNIDDVVLTGLRAPSPQLAGDLEPDCDVDFDDLTRLMAYWLNACGDCDGADLIADGIVNLTDLSALAQNWLVGP
ncbi:MAG: hypothetical protein ABFR90_08665, partial [Planctomycetota bacterium]